MCHHTLFLTGAVCTTDANALCTRYLLRILDNRFRIVCGILQRSPGQKLLATLRLRAGKAHHFSSPVRVAAFAAA